ncbi:hypothetical protein [Lysinibacillus fusiformis]|uniref:hypothetical protein n=1 Tax=Lysinibacillus fusiformis TaxID=28031 RepID=UPI001880F2B2|nr:hypothetical protein [Lysinibacillus fusiformis]MBD8523986.1 hypothetical protein [Lysinibacillus fusiformis]
MKKVLLGHVGVDSGQLIIMDPCYINSQWKGYNDNIIGVKLWGEAHHEIYNFLLLKYPKLHFTYQNHIIKAAVKDENLANEILSYAYMQSLSLGKKIVFDKETDSTYEKICNVTNDNKKQGGPIAYSKGHEGFAVAFRSGVGDGLYPVFATMEEISGWGESITKVEIQFVNKAK